MVRPCWPRSTSPSPEWTPAGGWRRTRPAATRPASPRHRGTAARPAASPRGATRPPLQQAAALLVARAVQRRQHAPTANGRLRGRRRSRQRWPHQLERAVIVEPAISARMNCMSARADDHYIRSPSLSFLFSRARLQAARNSRIGIALMRRGSPGPGPRTRAPPCPHCTVSPRRSTWRIWLFAAPVLDPGLDLDVLAIGGRVAELRLRVDQGRADDAARWPWSRAARHAAGGAELAEGGVEPPEVVGEEHDLHAQGRSR